MSNNFSGGDLKKVLSKLQKNLTTIKSGLSAEQQVKFNGFQQQLNKTMKFDFSKLSPEEIMEKTERAKAEIATLLDKHGVKGFNS
jgi:hypothetical protein